MIENIVQFLVILALGFEVLDGNSPFPVLFDKTGYGLSFPLTDGLTQNLAVDEGGAGSGGIAEGRPRAAACNP